MTKRIYRYEFNKILKSIPDISLKEREYLNKCFQHLLNDGLTEFELKQKINSLYHNKKDQLEGWELEKLKKKLLEKL